MRVFLLSMLLLVVSVGFSQAADTDHGAVWDKALAAEAQNAAAQAALAKTVKDAGVKLGDWYAIGPFKDEAFGNIAKSFPFVFAPEKDALAAKNGQVDLTKVYQAKKFPGMLDTKRSWVKQSKWSDGYRNILPRGPAPSRNESVYIYRTIIAKKAIQLAGRFRTEDFWRVWLNGAPVVTSAKVARYPRVSGVKITLNAGVNHLLIKTTSRWAEHGFSFAIAGMTADYSPRPKTPVSAANLPYASSDRAAAARYPKDAKFMTLCIDRLKAFQGAPTPIPMYSPARFEIDEYLNRRYPVSAEIDAYCKQLAAVQIDVQAALASVGTGHADAAKRVIDACAKIDKAHVDQIAKLPPVLFIRRPMMRVNAIAPFQYSTVKSSSICVFDPANRNKPVRVVFEKTGLSIYDMDLSYDAKTVYFSAKDIGGGHIYSIGVDGKGLRQLTSGAHDNISPTQLPDGRIMFVSTRLGTYVQCQTRKASNLFSMNADGTDVRHLSANIDSDHTPRVMNDGKVLFTRWDYGIEKNVFARHALWAMNPDGTALQLVFGNTIEDPAAFWKARAIPGRPEIVCVLGPHHNYQAGMIGVVTTHFGPEATRGSGFRWITREMPVYGDTRYANGFQDPFPVNSKQFLVSYGGDADKINRLYLLDDCDNRKCIYEDAKLGCWYPMLLAERKTPPGVPSQSKELGFELRDPEVRNRTPDAKRFGTLFVQDVYQGISAHVKRGQAKSLMVIEQVQKSRMMSGGEAWGHTPIIGRGTVHVRRVLGVVPVEKDGSAHFTAPALRSISLNLLDADGKLLMRMGSDMHIMPGERRSCVGCHEIREKDMVPPVTAGKRPIAAMRQPSTPKQPNWGTDGLIDYIRVVQPVLDKYCIRCHAGATPKGGVNLTSDRTRFFCQSYDNLVDRGLANFVNVFAQGHDDGTPVSEGSYTSKINKYIDTKKHCKKEISSEEKQRIYTWIDANVPYYGSYTYTTLRSRRLGARDSWGGKGGGPWMRKDVAPVFKKRCYSCHERKAFNPAWYTPGNITITSKLWTDRGIMAHGFPSRYPMSGLLGPEFRINLTNPDHSTLLTAPLAKKAGGMGLCRAKDGKPYIFKDKTDPDYQTMLKAIGVGAKELKDHPRQDMLPVGVITGKGRPEDFYPHSTVPVVEKPVKKAPVFVKTKLKNVAMLRGIDKSVKNLATGAEASSPDKIPPQGPRPPAAAVDGNASTYWDDADGAKLYVLRVEFDEPTNINAMSLVGWKHYDFAPRDFQIVCDGKVIGSVVGLKYVKNYAAMNIPQTTCKSFELRITGSYGGSPGVRELGIYNVQ
ncbi:MAG: hypothetical protein HN350_14005 [Phycisphaerales bacterium]|nr:hypothetical protein [Phycisphaerales bacterium]